MNAKDRAAKKELVKQVYELVDALLLAKSGAKEYDGGHIDSHIENRQMCLHEAGASWEQVGAADSAICAGIRYGLQPRRYELVHRALRAMRA